MALDLVVRKSDSIATLVHDDPSMEIDGVLAISEMLYAQSDRGIRPIGRLAPEIIADLYSCKRCIVVLMAGYEVVSTKEAKIVLNPD